MVVSELRQLTKRSIGTLLLSLGIAVRWSAAPKYASEAVGLTARCATLGSTCSTANPVIPPQVARTFVSPGRSFETDPLAEIAAMAVSSTLQVGCVVGVSTRT